MLRECLSNTTAHGIPQLVNKDNKFLSKCIWIIIIISSAGTFVYHSTSLVLKYLQKDTYVSLSLDGRNFTVPDIFICNNRPFSYVSMEKRYLEKNETFLNMLSQLNSSKEVGYYFALNRYFRGYSKRLVLEMLGNRNYTDILTSYNVDNNFVSDNSQIFQQVMVSKHGLCYKLYDKHKRYIFQEDQLMFLLYTDEYSSYQSHSNLGGSTNPSYGHTVYFTIPGYAPNDGSIKVNVERGKITTINIKMDFYDRLNQKHKPCQKKKSTVTYISDWNDANSQTISYYYKAYDCALASLHKYLLRECNCSWGSIPLDINLWKQSTFKLCSGLIHEKKLSCLTEAKSARAFLSECIQHNPCGQAIYHAEYNSGPLTRNVIDMYVNIHRKKVHREFILWKEYAEWKINSSSSEPIPDRFINSFTQIFINAPSQTANYWKEYLSYEIKDLLSDIGGILGFYLGVSVITLFEIFVYFMTSRPIPNNPTI